MFVLYEWQVELVIDIAKTKIANDYIEDKLNYGHHGKTVFRNKKST